MPVYLPVRGVKRAVGGVSVLPDAH